MSIKTYKLVDTDLLDADLKSIADKFREKMNKPNELFEFPTDYVSAIGELLYDAEPNGVESLSVDGPTVRAAAGYYPTLVETSVASGTAKIQDLNIGVNMSRVDNVITAEITTDHNDILTSSFTEGYITSVEAGVITKENNNNTFTLPVFDVIETPINPSPEAIIRLDTSNKWMTDDILIAAIGADYINAFNIVSDVKTLTVEDNRITGFAGYYDLDIDITIDIPEINIHDEYDTDNNSILIKDAEGNTLLTLDYVLVKAQFEPGAEE